MASQSSHPPCSRWEMALQSSHPPCSRWEMASQSSHPPCSRWEWHRRAVIHPARDGNGIIEQLSVLVGGGNRDRTTVISPSGHPPFCCCIVLLASFHGHPTRSKPCRITDILLLEKLLALHHFTVNRGDNRILCICPKPAQKGDVMTHYTRSQL